MMYTQGVVVSRYLVIQLTFKTLKARKSFIFLVYFQSVLPWKFCLLPPQRRLCFHLCGSVCLSVFQQHYAKSDKPIFMILLVGRSWALSTEELIKFQWWSSSGSIFHFLYIARERERAVYLGCVSRTGKEIWTKKAHNPQGDLPIGVDLMQIEICFQTSAGLCTLNGLAF